MLRRTKHVARGGLVYWAATVGVLCLLFAVRAWMFQHTIRSPATTMHGEQPTRPNATSNEQAAVDRVGGLSKLAVAANIENSAGAPAVDVASPQPGHMLALDPPSDEGNGRIPTLDEALRSERRDEAHELATLEAVRNALRGDPAAERVAATCSRTLCRLQIDKLVGVGMAWHEIDAALQPIMPGETVIQTEPNGGTGYVYSAERGTRLPL